MRAAYLLVKFTLKFSLWIYYPKTKTINAPKNRFGRTIFVCNHAASFMDPLVIAGNQKPIFFFMTRSDVFKGLLKPILWAAHMLPIYRSLDGEDTKRKNEEVFKKCNRILKNGRNLMIFAEGFTDDTFIRRLKPIKKGAARIGFGALEACNWEKNIYLQATGCNYSHPNKLGSSMVISNSEKICLNNYKEDYLKNPNKTITEITKRIEKLLQEQLTHIQNVDDANFHEQIMQLTRKGMNAENSDQNIPLLKRYTYSKQLASWINNQDLEANSQLAQLKLKIADYFNTIKKEKIEEADVYHFSKGVQSKFKTYLFLILSFPFMLIGVFHGLIPYLITKKFVERVMKRKVFWGSVKMMMGHLLFALYNIVILVLVNYFVLQNGAMWLAYFFTIPMLTGLIAYKWFKIRTKLQRNKMLGKRDFSSIIKMRSECLEAIHSTIPVA
ncbi:MAG: 1-acyl-sn-glycerol-3-phosphate acyltransferase [Lishizhenia sp.]